MSKVPTYGYSQEVHLSFDVALERVRAELAKEGFGVLTEIDVKKTLRAKLGADWSNYVILGACNPPLAHRALRAEKEVGLLLPCNVIVYEDGDTTFVSAIRPTVAMSMVENPALAALAKEVEEKLIRVVDSVAGV